MVNKSYDQHLYTISRVSAMHEELSAMILYSILLHPFPFKYSVEILASHSVKRAYQCRYHTLSMIITFLVNIFKCCRKNLPKLSQIHSLYAYSSAECHLQDTEGGPFESSLICQIVFSKWQQPVLLCSGEIYTNVIKLYQTLKTTTYVALMTNTLNKNKQKPFPLGNTSYMDKIMSLYSVNN